MNRLLCLAALLLPGVASATADFRIDSITPSCDIQDTPVVTITVTNTGNHAGTTYIDVFFGRSTPPAMGEWGDLYIDTGMILAGTTRSYSVTLPMAAGRDGWIDIILDTDQYYSEANESDNLGWAYFDGALCRG
jgi:hypothetical protein